MATIKGLSAKNKPSTSYIDTLKENSEREKEAMDRKLLIEQEQKEMQRKMLELGQLGDAPIAQAAVEEVAPKAVEEVAPKAVEPMAQAEQPNEKAKRGSAKKDARIAFLNEKGVMEFNGQFQIKQTKSMGFSTIGFSAPKDIALEVKVKAARDGLSLFELNNLLFALYLEKGFPKEFLERYRKSIPD